LKSLNHLNPAAINMNVNAFMSSMFVDKPYLLLGNTITLHSYYFAEKTGNLIGLLPGTSTVVNIPGPFVSFQKRCLQTHELTIILPEGKAETSRNPPLLQKTNIRLKELS
jgi:hypothetical protein